MSTPERNKECQKLPWHGPQMLHSLQLRAILQYEAEAEVAVVVVSNDIMMSQRRQGIGS